jgi:hypothetical protein
MEEYDIRPAWVPRELEDKKTRHTPVRAALQIDNPSNEHGHLLIGQLSGERLGKTPDVTLKACISKSRKGGQLELKATFRADPRTIGLHPSVLNHQDRLESSAHIQAWNWVESELHKVDFTLTAPEEDLIDFKGDTTGQVASAAAASTTADATTATTAAAPTTVTIPAAITGGWNNHQVVNPSRFDDPAWHSKFKEQFQGPIPKIPVTEVPEGLIGVQSDFKVFRLTLKVNMAAGRISNMFTYASLEKQYNSQGKLEDTPDISAKYQYWKQTFGTIENFYTTPNLAGHDQNDQTLKLWLRGESGTPVQQILEGLIQTFEEVMTNGPTWRSIYPEKYHRIGSGEPHIQFNQSPPLDKPLPLNENASAVAFSDPNEFLSYQAMGLVEAITIQKEIVRNFEILTYEIKYIASDGMDDKYLFAILPMPEGGALRLNEGDQVEGLFLNTSSSTWKGEVMASTPWQNPGDVIFKFIRPHIPVPDTASEELKKQKQPYIKDKIPCIPIHLLTTLEAIRAAVKAQKTIPMIVRIQDSDLTERRGLNAISTIQQGSIRHPDSNARERIPMPRLQQ